MKKENHIPVTELFETETSRRLIRFALNHQGKGEFYRTNELATNIEKSKNAVRRVTHSVDGRISLMVRCGIFEPKHHILDEPNIPHYKPADSGVMDLIEQWDDYPLFELLGSEGRLKLITFFIREGSGQAWSYNQITQESPIGYQACADYMNKLSDAGLVEDVEGTRSTKYRLNTDSEIYAFLHDLNNAIVEHASQFDV